MVVWVLSVAFTGVGCEDDPRDLDYLHDAGTPGAKMAGKMTAPDAGAATADEPLPDAGGPSAIAPVVTDPDAGTDSDGG